jgi:hypothetical protein
VNSWPIRELKIKEIPNGNVVKVKISVYMADV